MNNIKSNTISDPSDVIEADNIGEIDDEKGIVLFFCTEMRV